MPPLLQAGTGCLHHAAEFFLQHIKVVIIKIGGRCAGLGVTTGTRAFDRAVKRARERYEKTNSLCDESFLKDLRFHDLRHEATSRLAEIFPMHELTKITGHKDPRMLMRYYHPKAEDLALKLK